MKVFVIQLSFLLVLSISGTAQDYLLEPCSNRTFKKQITYFEKYNGTISISDKQLIKYNENVIEIWDSDSLMRLIFEIGIIYPEIIASTPTNGKEVKFDSITHKIKPWFVLDSKDTFTISNVKLVLLNNSTIKSRRFQFLKIRDGTANPSLYYFELTNEDATKKTNLRNFILGAKLTLFRFCTRLI